MSESLSFEPACCQVTQFYHPSGQAPNQQNLNILPQLHSVSFSSIELRDNLLRFQISEIPKPWEAVVEKVFSLPFKAALCHIALVLADIIIDVGGKAKPLKAPKKQKQELDEDDIAYREKLKAGIY